MSQKPIVREIRLLLYNKRCGRSFKDFNIESSNYILINGTSRWCVRPTFSEWSMNCCMLAPTFNCAASCKRVNNNCGASLKTLGFPWGTAKHKGINE